jgi:hypothetical protein
LQHFPVDFIRAESVAHPLLLCETQAVPHRAISPILGQSGNSETNWRPKKLGSLSNSSLVTLELFQYPTREHGHACKIWYVSFVWNKHLYFVNPMNTWMVELVELSFLNHFRFEELGNILWLGKVDHGILAPVKIWVMGTTGVWKHDFHRGKMGTSI